MADLGSGATAAVRTADVLLRAAGGRAALLRMPAQANAGDATEQLGLAVPTFQDVELGSDCVSNGAAGGDDRGAAAGKAARWELMVSATAVDALVGTLGYSTANVLFATAFGVLIDGVLMEIVSATASEVFGTAYVYRLVLHAPVALVV